MPFALRTAVVALAFALASSASAQSHLADSSGVYAGLTDLSLGASSSDVQATLGGVLGYRQANGLDYELGVRFGHSGTGSSFQFSPSLGLTRPLGSGFFSRTEAQLSYRQGNYNDRFFVLEPGEETSVRDLSVSSSDLVAAVRTGLGREFRLVGSLKAHPSIGLYGQASRLLTFSERGLSERGIDPAQPGWMRYAAGAYAELPLSVRLFGRDVTLTTSIAGPFVNSTGAPFEPIANGGLRINF